MAPLGVILAGGRSRRMGGGDKGLVRLGEQTLLERIVARVGPQTGGVVLSANGDPARFARLGLTVVPDGPGPGVGPLGGILAALDHAARWTRTTFVLTVPSDTPFLPLDLVRRLEQARLEAGAAGAVATSGGRVHPVVGLWPAACRDGLGRLVEAGERSLNKVVEQLGFAQAAWPDDPDPFFNVNTPEDLAAAQSRHAAFPEG